MSAKQAKKEERSGHARASESLNESVCPVGTKDLWRIVDRIKGLYFIQIGYQIVCKPILFRFDSLHTIGHVNRVELFPVAGVWPLGRFRFTCVTVFTRRFVLIVKMFRSGCRREPSGATSGDCYWWQVL